MTPSFELTTSVSSAGTGRRHKDRRKLKKTLRQAKLVRELRRTHDTAVMAGVLREKALREKWSKIDELPQCDVYAYSKVDLRFFVYNDICRAVVPWR